MRVRRITSSTTDDDVDPAYLPGGRGFVFTSNRQSKSKTVINGTSYYALDEYERERVLNDFWQTWEIAGVALVDVATWHWMYAHPEASPAELREGLNLILGSAGDAELEPFRRAGDGVPVRWLHQVV